MSKGGVNRGMRGLLASSCLAKCKVALNCPSFVFGNADGSVTTYEIKEGMGSMVISQTDKNADDTEKHEMQYDPDKPEKEEEEEEDDGYDRKVTLTGTRVDIGADDDMAGSVTDVVEYFREQTCRLFDARIVDMSLVLGIVGESMTLISGSVTTTLNLFTSNLIGKGADGEMELAEFMVGQVGGASASNCITDGPDCQEAHYWVPRLLVVLHRSKQKFPRADKKLLYRAVKARVREVSETIGKENVKVCVSCMHVYTGEKRKHERDKRVYRIPKPVATDVPKRPCRAADETKAHCYIVNATESPYCKCLIRPNAPPEPPRKFGPARIKKDPLADKLMNGPSLRIGGMKCKGMVSRRRSREVRPEAPPQLQPYRTRASYSLERAPRMYGKTPFGYEFIDKTKDSANRNLHLIRRF